MCSIIILEFDGSIIIVPSSSLKRMLFSFSFSAHYALKLFCGSFCHEFEWNTHCEYFQQTVIRKMLICVCRCMDKQMGLFTTALGTHTTVILLLQNLSCIHSRGKIRNKKLRKIPNLLSKILSHGVTLLLNYTIYIHL